MGTPTGSFSLPPFFVVGGFLPLPLDESGHAYSYLVDPHLRAFPLEEGEPQADLGYHLCFSPSSLPSHDPDALLFAGSILSCHASFPSAQFSRSEWFDHFLPRVLPSSRLSSFYAELRFVPRFSILRPGIRFFSLTIEYACGYIAAYFRACEVCHAKSSCFPFFPFPPSLFLRISPDLFPLTPPPAAVGTLSDKTLTAIKSPTGCFYTLRCHTSLLSVSTSHLSFLF